MRNQLRTALLGGLGAALLLLTTGCASSGSHSLGYSSDPYGSGYGYGYSSYGYRPAPYGYGGCRRGPAYRPYRSYHRHRRRPGVAVGFYLD